MWAQGKKIKTWIDGGTASAVALGIGLGAAVAAVTLVSGGFGIFAMAVVASGATAAGVGVGWFTHHSASEYAKSEASFQSIKQDFDHLLKITHDLELDMARVHTKLDTISTQVNNTTYWAKNDSSVLLVHDALERLSVKCSESQDTTSKCQKRMNCKISQLKKKCAHTDAVR